MLSPESWRRVWISLAIVPVFSVVFLIAGEGLGEGIGFGLLCSVGYSLVESRARAAGLINGERPTGRDTLRLITVFVLGALALVAAATVVVLMAGG